MFHPVYSTSLVIEDRGEEIWSRFWTAGPDPLVRLSPYKIPGLLQLPTGDLPPCTSLSLALGSAVETARDLSVGIRCRRAVLSATKAIVKPMNSLCSQKREPALHATRVSAHSKALAAQPL